MQTLGTMLDQDQTALLDLYVSSGSRIGLNSVTFGAFFWRYSRVDQMVAQTVVQLMCSSKVFHQRSIIPVCLSRLVMGAVLLVLISGCNSSSEKNFVIDCNGKTTVSDYEVGGASTEKRTVDTLRLSFEGKNVYLSGTAAKFYLKSYEVCNDAKRISFEDTCKRVITDETQLSYSVDSFTGQYDTDAKVLTMSSAMRSYARPNKSESFQMKSQALRGGTYTCSQF